MNEFDEYAYQDFSIPEMESLIAADWRQAWHQPVRVAGYLRATYWFSFLSEDPEAPPSIIIPGPSLRDALEVNTRGWSLAGGCVQFEGPATIWSDGFSQVPIPGFAIHLLRPIRIRFASRNRGGPPNEPVEFELPQPTTSTRTVEMLGRGDFTSLVCVQDDYSTSMLLSRRGVQLLAECFFNAEELVQSLLEKSRDESNHSTNQELLSKAELVRGMLQSAIRDYEKFCYEHSIALRYRSSIFDRPSPLEMK